MTKTTAEAAEPTPPPYMGDTEYGIEDAIGNAIVAPYPPDVFPKSYVLKIEGVPYEHCRTDDQGRWIYRRA